MIIGVIITLLWGSFLVYLNTSYQSQNEQFIIARNDLLINAQSNVVTMYEKFSGFIYSAIIDKPEILEIMRASKYASDSECEDLRTSLNQQLSEVYDVALKYEFRQLHFHTHDGMSFYRFHSPDKYGDDLTGVRDSIRIVSTLNEYVFGFEEGRIFNGYRFVYPLFYESEYVGSVEISISMSSVVKLLSSIYPNNDVGFILNRSVMENTVFDEEQSRYFISYLSEDYVSDREVFESIKQNANSLKMYKDDAFMDKLKQIAQEDLNKGTSFYKSILFEGDIYLVQYNALTNVVGKSVAYTFMIGKSQELEKLLDYRNILIFILTIAYALLWGGLFALDRHRKKINNMAMRDHLTQCYNRHFFFEFAYKELAKSERNGFPMAFAIFDVDFFKRVNDVYGHSVGDLVLKEIPRVVEKSIRVGDIFARYGGEEFVLLMPNTSLENALTVAERIRKNMASHSFPIVSHITISIGIAVRLEDETIDKCIERADANMYKAKEKGRNRVEH